MTKNPKKTILPNGIIKQKDIFKAFLDVIDTDAPILKSKPPKKPKNKYIKLLIFLSFVFFIVFLYYNF